MCHLAVQSQWKLEDLEWSALDFSSLPAPFRNAAANIFATLYLGETTAQRSAARLMEFLPDASARAFCETQVQDEARHAAFFARILAHLGCDGAVHPDIQRIMLEVEDAATPEILVAGMHILIESFAQSVFTEAGRLFGALNDERVHAGPVRSFKIIAADWMSRLLARDESRHVAFGLYYLRERIPLLGLTERRRLTAQIERWCQWVVCEARTPDLINSVGVNGSALCEQLVRDLNLRLAQIGLDCRLASLRT